MGRNIFTENKYHTLGLWPHNNNCIVTSLSNDITRKQNIDNNNNNKKNLFNFQTNYTKFRRIHLYSMKYQPTKCKLDWCYSFWVLRAKRCTDRQTDRNKLITITLSYPQALKMKLKSFSWLSQWILHKTFKFCKFYDYFKLQRNNVFLFIQFIQSVCR